jgi:hypothetical protein
VEDGRAVALLPCQQLLHHRSPHLGVRRRPRAADLGSPAPGSRAGGAGVRLGLGIAGECEARRVVMLEDMPAWDGSRFPCSAPPEGVKKPYALGQHQDKREEARQLLVGIDGWFTEGFETTDLQEANALWAALSR